MRGIVIRMLKKTLILLICGIVSGILAELDILSSSMPVIIQTPKNCNRWEEILPVLQMIKNTTNIKKERLFNVIKIIKFLLSDDMEKDEYEKIECITNTENFEEEWEKRFENTVDEKLKHLKEVVDDNGSMLINNENSNFIRDTVILRNKDSIRALDGDNILQNDNENKKTQDINRVLTRISAALAKVKENECNIDKELETWFMMPIVQSKAETLNNYNEMTSYSANKYDHSDISKHFNLITSKPTFTIPCQTAADVMDESIHLAITNQAYTDTSQNFNFDSIGRTTKTLLDHLSVGHILPNSITCVDSEDTVAMLFKPKTISLMQVYGNMLRKISITVLVPFHISKLSLAG